MLKIYGNFVWWNLSLKSAMVWVRVGSIDVYIGIYRLMILFIYLFIYLFS